jgi:hypothetical protein
MSDAARAAASPDMPGASGASRAALLRQLERCRAGSAELLALPEEHRAALRACVVEYTGRLREAEVTPEGALVAVKSVLQEWMPTAAPAVRETIVRWSIDAYYAPRPPHDASELGRELPPPRAD